MGKGKRQGRTDILIFLSASTVLGAALAAYMYCKGIFPDSVDTDTFGHLFKINYLHQAIKEGNFYPVYTQYWYNGMELFRYWPPLAYYGAALLQFCTGGDVINAFYVFAGAVYLLNMLGWLFAGIREKRTGTAFLVGNLYFFCPDNIRIFMAEGNLPRILITSLLPFVFYFVWEILHYKHMKKLAGLWAVLWLITVSHYMIAAMTGISVFVFCVVYSIMNKAWRETVLVTVQMILSYLSAGIFLVPGLTGGGILSQDSEASVATISQWAQEALKSLNPFFRSGGGYVRSFYFGLAIFVIAAAGVLAANKRTGPGFLTALLIFLSTTTAVSAVVRLLPMSQVFWMQRFVPMAMCTFFFSILLWKELKKTALLFFTAIMLLDSLSTTFLLTETKKETVAESVEQDMSRYLLPEGMALAKNRIGILDNSTWGSAPAWYFSKDMDESSVPYSFGWAYQGAETIDNIVSINQAAQSGFYEFVFDRFLELGDDVLLVDKKLIPETEETEMNRAAELAGYTLVQENENVWLYRLEGAEGSFGIVKQYKNLAIGEHSREICYIYPQFGYGSSSCLEDYSLEELTKYEKLYLSGFTYRDKERAEELLEEAARRGVKIYVDMQHIPLNRLSGKAEFLKVYAQYVSFHEKFPILSTENGSQFKLDFRTSGYEVWNTVYLSGASEVLREAYYDNATSLPYVAGNGVQNLIFLGFNPVYYYQQEKKPELLTFLNEIFEETPGEICESKIVPIEVVHEGRRVTIFSDYDKVNTGLAALDCFETEEGRAVQQGSLLTVDRGKTVLDVKYTDFGAGVLVSAAGAAGSLIYWFVLFCRKGRKIENEADRIGSDMPGNRACGGNAGRKCG